MDPREQLLQLLFQTPLDRMENAVILARLNWRFIDDQVLGFVRARAQQFGGQVQSSASIDNAMVAMGGAREGADPYLQAQAGQAQSLFNILVIAATNRGEVPHDVPPLMRQHASDVLEGRMPIHQLAERMRAAGTPFAPNLEMLLGFGFAQSFVAMAFNPLLAFAIPLATLEQRVGVAKSPAPPAAKPAPGADASLVEVLLHESTEAADPKAAELVLQRALTAAQKTPRLDDDLKVLEYFVAVSGAIALEPETLTQLVRVLTDAESRRTHDDATAPLLAWLGRVVVAHQGLASHGPGLVAIATRLLERKLAEAQRADLATSAIDLQIRLGEYDAALGLVRKTIPQLQTASSRLDMTLAEADVLDAMGDRSAAWNTVAGFPQSTLAAGDRSRALEKLMILSPADSSQLDSLLQNYVAARSESPEPERSIGFMIAAASLSRSGKPARARDLVARIDGAALKRLPEPLRARVEAQLGDIRMLLGAS